MKSNVLPRRLALLLALTVTAACNRAGGAETAPQSDTQAGAPTPQVTQAAAQPAQGPPLRMVVYKTPSCGCCRAWVDHVKAAGFQVEVQDMPDVTPVKNEHGVPQHLGSCHTALVDGYVIEGHVPADVIRRLLSERPQVAGIAVPGMPAGSPGMEMGDRKDPYDVIAFARDGKVSVFESR